METNNIDESGYEFRITVIEDVLWGGQTKRFHNVKTIFENTVGQHSYGVAWLCYILSESGMRVNERLHLVMAALAHDVPEQETGDSPAPFKRQLPDNMHHWWKLTETEYLRERGIDFEALLTDEARRILKFSDALDGIFFCLTEVRAGNKMLFRPLANFFRYAADMCSEAPTERKLMQALRDAAKREGLPDEY